MQHLEEGLLHELLDGEIPSTDLPPIQAHLAACAECRARLEEARELAGEAERLVETIELTEREPRRRGAVPLRPTPRRWGRDFAWAATVLVAVGAGYMVRGGGQTVSLAERDSAAPDSVAAPVNVPPAEPERSTPAPAAANQPADRPQRTNARDALLRQEGAKDAANIASDAAAEGKLTAKASTSLDTARKGPPKLADSKFAVEELHIADKAAPQAAGGRAREAVLPAPATPRSLGASQRALRMEPAPAAANELRLDDAGRLTAALKREAAPVEITFLDALRRLSGSLRLIDGLVPLRLELVESDVRVVYPLTAGELFLEQQLVDGRITWRLVAPSSFPADSLQRLRARVRE